MNAYTKIGIGALMVILGTYSTITFWSEFLIMLKAAVGPLLVLVGAFIVWLESDELKLEREKKKQEKNDRAKGLQKQFGTADKEEETEETGGMNYEEVMEGTVQEVKERVKDMGNPTQEDYRELLEAEQRNKDRKTVKEFLKRKID